ncbi:MAG: histidinol-phosphatase [candidate division WOR-3 bacterium]|nr:MAG: histidinol-phosphatase [candidate division WOR-3 bacterium]
MIDYHVHTDHSVDASGTIAEYCARALEIGLNEICFTNHCELDPERNDSFIIFNGRREPFSKENLLRLQKEIFDARERFKEQGLNVKFGIEVGYDPGIETIIKDIIDCVDLDFVIGAVHCLGHICIDSSKECGSYFDRHDMDEYIEDYYTTAAALIKSRLFDSLAHFDVYKKYGRDRYGPAINNFPRDAATRVFQLMVANDVALEINTAGMRFMNEFYPGPLLTELAHDCGLRRITIGSDSHRPTDLAKDLALAFDYARSYGFKETCTFDRRRSSTISI